MYVCMYVYSLYKFDFYVFTLDLLHVSLYQSPIDKELSLGFAPQHFCSSVVLFCFL